MGSEPDMDSAKLYLWLELLFLRVLCWVYFVFFDILLLLTDILVTTPNRLIYLLKEDPPAIDLSRYESLFQMCFATQTWHS